MNRRNLSRPSRPPPFVGTLSLPERIVAFLSVSYTEDDGKCPTQRGEHFCTSSRHDTVNHDTANHDIEDHDTANHDTANHDTANHDTANHDIANHDTVSPTTVVLRYGDGIYALQSDGE
jgi:hypothetical protein